ncbi:hypothetical protein CAL29_10705 [Bordetella genomosp. 10]|uniref:HTH araC/xylS-type domain-containing protein n=1 Tax=Bordetella genomosp. 10 TaxID=1416804 RepID=A0A261SAQ8_9BORD|nr:AraC family transcriptional regulator [Bordetella genomosp. 10]OZI34022.1 hypothetical protein CAL29_10705 [Bordetella genomosp. 10]
MASSVNWSRQFSTDMTVSAGCVMPRTPLKITAPVFEGLQVIASLGSRLSSRVDDGPLFDISGAGVYLVISSGQHEGYDRLASGTLHQFVRVGIDPQSADRNGFDLGRMLQSGCKKLYSHGVTVFQLPLTPTLQAIARQTLTCPVQGPMQDMFIAGKGLELASIAIDSVLDRRNAHHDKLTNADLERLWHARELAVGHYQQPLTLHEIARQVGTNVGKLNTGFRQLFGATVFQYVQQHRLQEAHRMLSTGAYSVSEVASFVGYAIPHFSTLFRKRFGFPPKNLVR